MLPGFFHREAYVWVLSLNISLITRNHPVLLISQFFALDSTQPTVYPQGMNPLITARHQRGLSQTDVSTITGLSRQHIQRYESGRSNKAPVPLCAYYDEAAHVELGTHAIAYMHWINDRRLKLPLSEIKHILLGRNGNPPNYTQKSMVVPNRAMALIRERITWQSDVRPEDLDGANKHLGNMSDTYFICATMHVHPYSLAKWQETGKVPAVMWEICNLKDRQEAVQNGL